MKQIAGCGLPHVPCRTSSRPLVLGKINQAISYAKNRYYDIVLLLAITLDCATGGFRALERLALCACYSCLDIDSEPD